ncbi:MAG: hypothetical protein HYT87_17035 [Nitrospirae bacterium]|nr:hypothetical protein [Nitrospirota bacterium]
MTSDKATGEERTIRTFVETSVAAGFSPRFLTPKRIAQGAFILAMLALAACSEGAGCGGCGAALPPKSGKSFVDEDTKIPLSPIPHPTKGGACADKFGHDPATCNPAPFLNTEAIPFRLTADPSGADTDTGFEKIKVQILDLMKSDLIKWIINTSMPTDPVADMLGVKIWLKDTYPDQNGHTCPANSTGDANCVCNPSDTQFCMGKIMDYSSMTPTLPIDTANDTMNINIRIDNMIAELKIDGFGFERGRATIEYLTLYLKLDPVKRTDLSPYPSILSIDLGVDTTKGLDNSGIDAGKITLELGGLCGVPIIKEICTFLLSALINAFKGLFIGQLAGPLMDQVKGMLEGSLPIDVMALMTSWVQPTAIPQGTIPATGDPTCGGAEDPKWCTAECNPNSARYYGVQGGGNSLVGMAFYPHLDIDNNGFLLPFDFGMKPITTDLSQLKSSECFESIDKTSPPNPQTATAVKFEYRKFNGTNYHMAFGISQELLRWIFYQLYVSGSFCMQIPPPAAPESTDGSTSSTEASSLLDGFDITSIANPASFAFTLGSLETLFPAFKNFQTEGGASQPVILRTIPRGTPDVKIGNPRWKTSTTAGTCPDFVCNSNETKDSCPQDCRTDFEFSLPNFDVDFILKNLDGTEQRLMSLRTRMAYQVSVDYFTGEGFCPNSDFDSSNSDPACTPSKTVSGKDCTDSANSPTCCPIGFEYGCADNEYGEIADCAKCAKSDFKDGVACLGLDDNDLTDDDDACISLYFDSKLDVDSIQYLDVEPGKTLTDSGKRLTSGIAELLGEMLEMSLYADVKTKFSIPGIKFKFLHMGPEPMTKNEGTEGSDADGNGAKDYFTVYARFKQFDIIGLLGTDLIPSDVCNDDGTCQLNIGETELNCPDDCATRNSQYCAPGEEAKWYGPSEDCKCGDGICQMGQGEKYTECGSKVYTANEKGECTGTATNCGCSDCGAPPCCGNKSCEGCEAKDGTCTDGRTDFHCTTDCFAGDKVCSAGLGESMFSGDALSKGDCLTTCSPESSGGGFALFAPARMGAGSTVADSPAAPKTFIALSKSGPAQEFINLDPKQTVANGISPAGGVVYVLYEDDRDTSAKYTWRVDDMPWQIFSADPDLHLGPQIEGRHTLEVQGIDTDRNIDSTPAVLKYAVDSQPPVIRVIGPAYPGKDLVRLTAHVTDYVSERSDINAEWSLDGAAYQALPQDGLVELSGLEQGSAHDLLVRATDEADNKEFTQYHFTVEYKSDSSEAGMTCGCAVLPGSPTDPWSTLLPSVLLLAFFLSRRGQGQGVKS